MLISRCRENLSPRNLIMVTPRWQEVKGMLTIFNVPGSRRVEKVGVDVLHGCGVFGVRHPRAHPFSTNLHPYTGRSFGSAGGGGLVK